MLFRHLFARLLSGARLTPLDHALRAAIAGHRPGRLRALLAGHGTRAFARSLSRLSTRTIADALSMLPLGEQVRVRQALSFSARRRLQQAALHRVHRTGSIRTGMASLGVKP